VEIGDRTITELAKQIRAHSSLKKKKA